MLSILKTITDNISMKAKKHSKVLNVSSFLNMETLMESCHQLDGRKAVGIDGVAKEAYIKDLEHNISELAEKLRRDNYNPQPSRRILIDKPGSSKRRPLGISCYEDKIVENVVATILSAVYETKFMDFSYGFRPRKNCHMAISALMKTINRKKIAFVVEADIKSFFDTMDHNKLIEFLEHDIADKKHIRLIRKFLKAGIVENGKFLLREEGSPQGSIISPVLANIYLHYVLDLWFEKVVKKHCRGEAYMIRYADDFVCGFQCEDDARKFYKALFMRLDRFGLQIAEDKTKILCFGKHAWQNRTKLGQNKPKTFDFLGFTFYCSQSYKIGCFQVELKTSKKRIREKLANLKVWLRKHIHLDLDILIKSVNRSLVGYYHYFGVTFNYRSLKAFYYRVRKLIFHVLNRRSQKKSYTWERFLEAIDKYHPLVRPKLYVSLIAKEPNHAES